MTSDTEFDSIKPYEGDMVRAAIERVKDSQDFLNIFSRLSGIPGKDILDLFKDVLSRKDFQHKVWTPLTECILKKSSKNLTIAGLENLDKDNSYLYISNHRDIILDAAILNMILQVHQLKTCRNAIGDNLLVNDWITDLIKLASCFIIERNVSVREMLACSMLRSRYIRETIQEKEESIWIAEREGRTKNGDDRSQPALLKMLKMSGNKIFLENFKELHIIISTVSYEWEPCDYLKIQENYLKRHSAYQKTKDLDLLAMITGMTEQKGNIHYSFAPVTDKMLENIAILPSNGQRINALAAQIDKIVHENYHLWPNNYIAYDIINQSSGFSENYTPGQKESFIRYISDKSAALKGDKAEMENMFLELYSNPVTNKENIK